MSGNAAPRKKLIEVSMPLEAINVASAREKSIRHGHPSTLHLWWARRPLAACRAVIFGQLVDDPCSWPDRFPTEEAQDAERERLHGIIRDFVEWPGSKPADRAKWERALDAARYEIARSVAWGRGEEPPQERAAVLAYLAEHAPPVYDPFCGGGSIPLEAQRLGLRAYGSDLNPVPVLISKALVEIPPKFAGLAPVHPGAPARSGLERPWAGAEGLAADVRHYGAWMREQARARIGHLYPDVELPDGRKATVIAWLWARTVRSPDPAAKGAMVPLASSFILSSKAGKEAIVQVVHDPEAPDGWRFAVKQGGVTKEELAAAKLGTKSAKAGAFICALTGSPIERPYIQAQGKADQLGQQLMAIVAEGDRKRIYLSPTSDQEEAAAKASASELLADARGTFLNGATPTRAMITGGVCSAYGLRTWGHLFTDRQLVALATFADLVGEVREKALHDARAAFAAGGLREDSRTLADGGCGAKAYADALGTYLGLALDRAVMGTNTLTRWNGVGEKAQHCFGRQALAMVWDFAETNVLGEATGSIDSGFEMTANALTTLASGQQDNRILHADAPSGVATMLGSVISTDPPYYDNVAYADLSDFFYVWLRLSLSEVWPDLFRRLQTPKDEELVATPYRAPDRAEMARRAGRDDHPILRDWDKLSPKDRAEREFMFGMGRTLMAMRNAADPTVPLTIYYAFKQSEKSEDGVSSPGWASFLQAMVDSGLVVDGAWPIRTEMATRLVASSANALASSIVLVCRPRPENARAISRRDFLTQLRAELPEAISRMREAGLHPVDIPQAALGPGMGVFSRYPLVREADDSAMSVGQAIALINQVRGEIEHEQSGDLDAATRFALDWFASYGWGKAESGRAIQLAQSYDLTERGLREAGVLATERGDARLLTRAEMAADWRPSRDRTLTAWELAQALNRALNDGGGIDAAGALLAEARELGGAVHFLTARLFGLAEDRRMSEEARGWGQLSEAWDAIEAAADRGDVAEAGAMARAVTGDLF